jgi:hypothetical protein
MISMNSVITVTKELVSADLGEEVAILHLENGVYYGLDAVGARIWDLIQEPKRVDELQNSILMEYDVEPGRCKSDLLDLLEELEGQGLVEIKEVEQSS